MPSQRHDQPISSEQGHAAENALVRNTPEQAAKAIQSLRNRIVHIAVSDPADASRTTYAEFELPMSESIITVFSIILASEQHRYTQLQELYDQVSTRPSARVRAALKELEQTTPWFKTKEELFDALEAAGEE